MFHATFYETARAYKGMNRFEPREFRIVVVILTGFAENIHILFTVLEAAMAVDSTLH